MSNDTSAFDILYVVLNEYMSFERPFTEDEVREILAEFSENNVYTMSDNINNILVYWLSQLKYPTIRRVDDTTLVFVGNPDNFIITNEGRFLLREYDTQYNVEDPYMSDFNDILNKTFIAAYSPDENNIEVSISERMIYKLLSIIENIHGSDVIYYALNEYLRQHERHNTTN